MQIQMQMQLSEFVLGICVQLCEVMVQSLNAAGTLHSGGVKNMCTKASLDKTDRIH